MNERIDVVVVDHFPAMGRLVALRFLKWVQEHPGGVVSLPTGKTPEHFIRWVERLLATWQDPDTQALLRREGLAPDIVPDMKSLRFVQIDEFYPIDPTQHNSFCHYVNAFYVRGFGLDPDKALLIDGSRVGLSVGQTIESVWPDKRVDLSLRNRAARTAREEVQKQALERIDQWCQEYEQKVRAMGGIGFFLGGIGPDGHIGFNVRGSDHFSTTRLTATNYETQAAAATDLGGIEISRERLVITIGLGTIAFNPDCTALIVAAGEAKSGVVADAVQKAPDVLYPATVLHKLPNACFCITAGAAKQLLRRQRELLVSAPELSEAQIEKILIDTSVRTGKPLRELRRDDLAGDPFGAILLDRTSMPLDTLTEQVRVRLVDRVERGRRPLERTQFLHTEPHHDDLMLGYLAAIVRNIRQNSNHHHFATLTSGFTAVTNAYVKGRLAHLAGLLRGPVFRELVGEGYFDPSSRSGQSRDLWQYLDGVAAGRAEMRDEGAARRLLRDLADVFGTQAPDELEQHMSELMRYLDAAYAGKKDPSHVQRLKGMIREWEADCLWGYFGFMGEDVSHLRLGFYKGDIFTEEPTANRDVAPVLELLRKCRPDVVSVALDPEGSGPDTHYKVMQTIRGALEAFLGEGGDAGLKVWGYRNVWYRFHPAEANVYVPVTLNMFSIMESAFMDTFISQREASFPSHEHDGPFCELARNIQVQQYQAIKTCLGREWFHEHPNALIRATRGLVFLKEMSPSEFFQHSHELQRAAEDR